MPEEHIAARKNTRAVFDRRQINFTSARESIPIRHDLAIDSEPRHAAVRENLEPQMREASIILNRKRILRVALKLRDWQNLRPLDFITRQLLDIHVTVNRTRLQRTLLRIVASEETCVADYAANNSGKTETNDAP